MATRKDFAAILRDASLRDAPQDEVIPHGEERILRVSNHEATRVVRAEVRMKNRTEIADRLAASGYIADGELATAVSLMQMLKRPLLLEGEAGGGKTEGAKGRGS